MTNWEGWHVSSTDRVTGKSCTYGYDLTDRLCEAVFDDWTATDIPMMPMTAW